MGQAVLGVPQMLGAQRCWDLEGCQEKAPATLSYWLLPKTESAEPPSGGHGSPSPWGLLVRAATGYLSRLGVTLGDGGTGLGPSGLCHSHIPLGQFWEPVTSPPSPVNKRFLNKWLPVWLHRNPFLCSAGTPFSLPNLLALGGRNLFLIAQKLP